MSQTILMMVGPEYEDLELWYPKIRLEEAGYEVPVAGLGDADYRGKHGYPCRADAAISEFTDSPLAGVVVPGGWAPDKIRRDPAALDVVRRVNEEGGLVASICHGPWVLISAGICAGRRMTSTVGIRDDLVNAGAEWVDEAAVTDGNLVTARVPSDLAEFARQILGFLVEG